MGLGDGGDPSTFSGRIHPLLIPLVAEHVLNFCSFEDLTSCRLVSKVWHDNSLKRWRSLTKVIIVGGDRRRSRAGFLNFVKDEKRKPGTFKPYSGHFVVGTLQNLDRFLKEFSFHITALELRNVTFKNVEVLRKVIFQSCPTMKELTLLNPIRVLNSPQDIPEPTEWMQPQFGENRNLKRLTLPRRTESFGITRMEILSHFPGVEALIQKEGGFQADDWMESDDIKLFRVVEIIRNYDPNKLQLKSIEDLGIVQPVFNGYLCVPFSLARLRQNHPRLSLEHLTLSIVGSVNQAQYNLAHRIIYQQHESLKKLDLFRTPNGTYLNPFPFVFWVNKYYQLNNFEELTLRSRMFSSLLFLAAMRNLKKLTIYGWDDGYQDNIVKGTCWEDLDMKSLVLDKCTELNLAFHLEKEDLEKIVGIFPNVEKVTISLDNEMFAVVCKNWRKLVEFNVFDSSVDDLGITGVHEDEVTSVIQNWVYDSRGVVREMTPNISWLPNLRRFSISSWECFQVTRSLGHSSAILGFQQVPHLEYLHITNYDVQEDVKEALRASATSCVFTRVERDRETWLEDLKKKLF